MSTSSSPTDLAHKGQRRGEIGRHGAFAHTTLARHHQELHADLTHPALQVAAILELLFRFFWVAMFRGTLALGALAALGRWLRFLPSLDNLRMAALRVFDASRAQCSESLGSPPNAVRMSACEMLPASCVGFPAANSVAMLPAARDGPQPVVVKPIRSIRPSTTWSQNSIVSPHGPVIRAWPSKDSSGP